MENSILWTETSKVNLPWCEKIERVTDTYNRIFDSKAAAMEHCNERRKVNKAIPKPPVAPPAHGVKPSAIMRTSRISIPNFLSLPYTENLGCITPEQLKEHLTSLVSWIEKNAISWPEKTFGTFEEFAKTLLDYYEFPPTLEATIRTMLNEIRVNPES